MYKEALGLQDITRGYDKHIGSRPLVEAPVLGAAGAGLGYVGSDMAARGLLRVFMAGQTPAQREAIMEEMRKDGTLKLVRNLAAATGGALGAGYSLYKNTDRTQGARGALNSVFDPGYWDEPENIQRAADEARANVGKKKYDSKKMSKLYSSGRTPARQMQVQASFFADDLFTKDNIPLSASMDLINNDPFLTTRQKDFTGMVLEDAEGKSSGLASGKDLATSAIRLGVGLATGFAFGRVAGKMLSLPPLVTNRLSGVGAIAGGIVNTGIFRELGKK